MSCLTFYAFITKKKNEMTKILSKLNDTDAQYTTVSLLMLFFINAEEFLIFF